MVKLTVAEAAKTAIDEYFKQRTGQDEALDDEESERLKQLDEVELGSPIEHHDLIEISQYLVKATKGASEDGGEAQLKQYRLDTLLKGATIYQPPPPPKPEPTLEYKALMARLRKDEEQRSYERMLSPPQQPETFSQRFSNSSMSFNPNLSHGATTAANEEDEVTFQDINRQVILIINILISIITCSVFIWYAARRWPVPQRMGLSMSGSGLVAFAEVAIYLGYIRRIKEARVDEGKKVESQEIVGTWVIDRSGKGNGGIMIADGGKGEQKDGVRYRKGKHR